MPDRLPQTNLTQQMLRWQIAQQKESVERARTAVCELADRKARNDANIVAAKKAVAEIENAARNVGEASAVEKQRLRSQLHAQRATIERQILENLEGSERAARHDEAEKSALKSLEVYERQLGELDAAHGPLTEELYQALRAFVDDQNSSSSEGG